MKTKLAHFCIALATLSVTLAATLPTVAHAYDTRVPVNPTTQGIKISHNRDGRWAIENLND